MGLSQEFRGDTTQPITVLFKGLLELFFPEVSLGPLHRHVPAANGVMPGRRVRRPCSACQATCTTWGCVHLEEGGHLPLPKALSAPGATHTFWAEPARRGPPPHRQVGALLPTLYLLSLSLCFV